MMRTRYKIEKEKEDYRKDATRLIKSIFYLPPLHENHEYIHTIRAIRQNNQKFL